MPVENCRIRKIARIPDKMAGFLVSDPHDIFSEPVPDFNAPRKRGEKLSHPGFDPGRSAAEDLPRLAYKTGLVIPEPDYIQFFRQGRDVLFIAATGSVTYC